MKRTRVALAAVFLFAVRMACSVAAESGSPIAVAVSKNPSFQFRHERHSYTDWRIENRQVITTEITLDAEVLARDDGFKLIRLGRRGRLDGYFRYEKSGISFEFRANRAHPGGTITGTYDVSLDFKRGQKLGDAIWPVSRSKVEEIAADIYAALCAWPTPPQQENIPAGVVSFGIFTAGAAPGSNPDANSENDNKYHFTMGRPVTLRHFPLSTRWQRRFTAYRGDDRRGDPNVVADRETLVRDDGIELVRFQTLLGPADDGPDMYRYVEGDVSFDFSAERRVGTGLMTDTWEVQLDPDPRGRRTGLSSELRSRLGPERCVEVVANIEEALYAWPQWGYAFETPVNRVIFLDANRSCLR
jgi:hypothetical protein